ncbi:MAG: MBL fold metallo-hydrolase, partial [Ilumatobacteraceae bacterium]
MLSVEMLAARYGDSLLVTWGAPGDEHRMLIDAGLAGAYPAIKARLGELDCDIDLFVVTHVDIDHVGGAVKLLADDEVAQRVAGVWFNGYVHLEQFSDILGALDGERLTALIRARAMTWNEGWPDAPNDECGGAIVVRDVPPVVELGGGATITLLSPTPDKLRRLHDVWLKAITKAGLVDGTEGVRDEAEADRIADLLGSLADLADVRSDPDDAEANGSSIAFVFEHEGVRILFGADAHSDALLASLAHLAPEGDRHQ